MTEQGLREFVVRTARGDIGVVQGSDRHKQIVDTYNAFEPLPRKCKVKYTDPWCATNVSVIAIRTNTTDIIPRECSCGEMIKLFQQHPHSKWQENENYTPKIGDIVFYVWSDGADYATTDNTKWPDHVGIVSAVNGKDFVVVEGNYSKSVKERQMAVNGRYLRGFGLPAYAKKANEMEDDDMTQEKFDELLKSATKVFDTVEEMPDWAKPTIKKLVDKKILQGVGDVPGERLGLDEALVRVLVVNDRAGLYR